MLKKIFLRGLLAIAPIAITLAIVIWLYDFIETYFSEIFIDIFGSKYYFPGLGLIIALVLIFLIGILINNWMIKKLYNLFEKLLHKLPLIKTLYRSITDLMSFFKGNNKMSQGRVVMINFMGSKILGLVSRETFDDLPDGIGKEGDIAVYLPMSYQIGGITVILPRTEVHSVDMSIEEGLRFAATAGMPGEQQNDSE